MSSSFVGISGPGLMNRQANPVVSLYLASLEEGLNHVSQQVTPEALELAWSGADFGTAIDLEFDVIRMGDNLQVDGRFRGNMQATCDRCLQPLKLSFGGRFRVLGRRGDEKTHELGDQEGVVFHAGHDLDLTEEVREAILLEVPMRNLCAEDCLGLCIHCGTDRNQGDCDCARKTTDPRWAALGQLKPDQD